MIHAPLVLEAAVAMSELLTGAMVQLDDLAAVLDAYGRLQMLTSADVEVLYDLVAGRHAVTIVVQCVAPAP